jgi:hypothetical protein
MTEHQFDSNLYHKKKEKSKKSTKYCGHGSLPIQYLDVPKTPDFCHQDKSRQHSQDSPFHYGSPAKNRQIQLFQYVRKSEEGKIQKKYTGFPL